MKKDNIVFFSILTVLTILCGIGYYLVRNYLSPIYSTIFLAILYMPIPLYSLIIFSIYKRENLVTKYIDIKKLNINDFGYTLSIFLAWVVLLLLLTVLASYIFPTVFGQLTVTNEMFMSNLKNMVGEEAASSANLPPSPLFLIPFTLIPAIIAGMSINLIFALGEEIVWRGYLMDVFNKQSFLKRNIIIGTIWGLWHSPIIIQGYNYGNEYSYLGVLMFVIFCISFSLLLGLIFERGKSSILPAFIHGTFNAYAGIFAILIVGYNPFFDGAIGILSILSMLILFYIYRYGYRDKFST